MVIIIDNFDSFTYNIVQYIEEIGFKTKVFRNNVISLKDIDLLSPSHIVISPGPSNPNKAGISLKVIETFYQKYPILGICLGHQCIAQVFGASIIQAKEIYHGKMSIIHHDTKTIFRNIEAVTFQVTRYHSLVIDKKTLSEDLEVSAYSKEDNEIMGIRHKFFPIEGLQFHPESFATENGKQLLSSFLNYS